MDDNKEINKKISGVNVDIDSIVATGASMIAEGINKILSDNNIPVEESKKEFNADKIIKAAITMQRKMTERPENPRTKIFREQTQAAMAQRFTVERNMHTSKDDDGKSRTTRTIVSRSLIRQAITTSLSNHGNIGVSPMAGLAPRKERRAEARKDKVPFEPQYNLRSV